MHDIKTFFKRIYRAPMLLVFGLICVTLLPTAINLRSLAFRSGIVVAMGVDINEDGNYILDAMITIPSIDDSLSENNKLLTSTGISFIDALSNMSVIFGKTLKLGHIRYIMVGYKISEKNLALAIDGIIRTNKVRDSVQLIVCEDEVHDVFNVAIELKNKTGIKLSDIICHLEESSTTALDSNVDSFYKGYFSVSGISKLNSISLTGIYSQGISISNDSLSVNTGGNNTGNGGNALDGDSKKYISNIGRIAVFKNGVIQEILPKDISFAIYWLDSSYIPQKLIVETASVDNVDAICFEVLSKSVKFESFFLHGVPMLCTKINLTIDIDEIINRESGVVSKNQNLVKNGVKSDIGREIRKLVGNALNYSKSNKLDIMNINEIFYLLNNREYMEYLQTGVLSEDFLDDVQLNIDLNIKIV